MTFIKIDHDKRTLTATFPQTKKDILEGVQNVMVVGKGLVDYLPLVMRHRGYETISEVKKLKKSRLMGLFDMIAESYCNMDYEVQWNQKK